MSDPTLPARATPGRMDMIAITAAIQIIFRVFIFSSSSLF
jgi:hypothetical protein